MFHMMNEARIGIGTAAVVLGLAGYYACSITRRTAAGRPVGASEKTRRMRRSASSNMQM